MGFWSDSQQVDPKRAYRWVLRVGTIPTYTLKKVTKPAFTVTETGHKYLNHTYYYPGRVEWQTVSFTIADPVDPDMAISVANIIKNSGYSPAQAEGDLKTMSKTKSVRALGNKIDIVQIDSDGQPVETWTLINPWIKDVKYGELDYESDDITNIEVEVRYDWASCKTRNQPYTGVGGSNQVWTDGSAGDDRGTSGGVSDLETS
jgi:hypothetical protein